MLGTKAKLSVPTYDQFPPFWPPKNPTRMSAPTVFGLLDLHVGAFENAVWSYVSTLPVRLPTGHSVFITIIMRLRSVWLPPKKQIVSLWCAGQIASVLITYFFIVLEVAELASAAWAVIC